MKSKKFDALSFRAYCTEKWFEHKDEILSWTGRPLTEYNDKYYFNQHKWLLKRMYKDSKKKCLI